MHGGCCFIKVGINWFTCKVWGGGRTLFPIIKIGLYDCQGMLFRGSYSLLLVLYSTAVINLNCLLVFFFNSCFHVLLGPKGPKGPAQSSQVE